MCSHNEESLWELLPAVLFEYAFQISLHVIIKLVYMVYGYCLHSVFALEIHSFTTFTRTFRVQLGVNKALCHEDCL